MAIVLTWWSGHWMQRNRHGHLTLIGTRKTALAGQPKNQWHEAERRCGFQMRAFNGINGNMCRQYFSGLVYNEIIIIAMLSTDKSKWNIQSDNHLSAAGNCARPNGNVVTLDHHAQGTRAIFIIKSYKSVAGELFWLTQYFISLASFVCIVLHNSSVKNDDMNYMECSMFCSLFVFWFGCGADLYRN